MALGAAAGLVFSFAPTMPVAGTSSRQKVVPSSAAWHCAAARLVLGGNLRRSGSVRFQLAELKSTTAGPAPESFRAAESKAAALCLSTQRKRSLASQEAGS